MWPSREGKLEYQPNIYPNKIQKHYQLYLADVRKNTAAFIAVLDVNVASGTYGTTV
jgi:hypothetical protein